MSDRRFEISPSTTLRRTRPTRRTLLALGLAILALIAPLGSGLAAQDRPPAGGIGSDRPGLGDGAHVVGTGVWQLEVGATLAETATGDRQGVGSALVRYGLDPLELRFYLPSTVVSQEPGDTEVGDLGVGVKASLAQGESWRWSLVGGVTLPTGTEFATADDATGFATFVGETALTEAIAFTLNLGYGAAFDAFDDGTFSVIATPSFPVSDELSAYAGYAGFFDTGSDAEAHWLEGGLALARGADVQWDLNAAWDVDGESWFVGIGLATRWR